VGQLVRGGAVAAAGQRQGQFGGPAAAVEDRRLGVAGVEGGVVARRAAALAQGPGAEVAVVEVQRVAARQDRPVVEQGVEDKLGQLREENARLRRKLEQRGGRGEEGTQEAR